MVVRSTQYWNQTIQEVQFSITSIASNASKIGSAIRQQYSIENSVDWTFDVIFHEDEYRIDSLHSPLLILRMLRRIPFNALDRESSCRPSLRQKSR